jgi:hypothetical protein
MTTPRKPRRYVVLTEIEASMFLSNTFALPHESIEDMMSRTELIMLWMMGPATSMHDDLAACIHVPPRRGGRR